MRQISRVGFALLSASFSFAELSTAEAQQGTRSRTQQTAPQATQPKPAPTQKAPPVKQAMNVPVGPSAVSGKRSAAEDVTAPRAISRELQQILENWEVESAKIKTIHGVQSRSAFNKTFEVETVSRGEFFLETPDKGRIDMNEVKIKEGEKSNKLNKSGEPYALETGNSERWICTGDTILQIDDKEMTYCRIEIPETQRGSNIVHTPLPFLFGMKAEEAKDRYAMELRKETDDYAVILVIPRMEKDLQNYRKAQITLNKKTYLPTKVHLLVDEGTEVIYTFESARINERKLPQFFGGKDPYHPDLKKYILHIPNEVAEADSVNAGLPNRDARKTAPAAPNTAVRQPAATAERQPAGTNNKSAPRQSDSNIRPASNRK